MTPYEIVEKLIERGWEFKAWVYGKGWWVKPSGSHIEQMRRGDPKPFHLGAMTTWELYEGGK